MSIQKPLIIVFYKEQSAPFNEPVREWINSFDKDDAKKIGHSLMVVQYRWPLGMPWVKNLEKGLWEIRINLPNRIIRIICMAKGGMLILLHGFVKKSQKTPAREIDIARKRKKIFEQSQKEVFHEKK